MRAPVHWSPTKEQFPLSAVNAAVNAAVEGVRSSYPRRVRTSTLPTDVGGGVGHDQSHQVVCGVGGVVAGGTDSRELDDGGAGQDVVHLSTVSVGVSCGQVDCGQDVVMRVPTTHEPSVKPSLWAVGRWGSICWLLRGPGPSAQPIQRAHEAPPRLQALPSPGRAPVAVPCSLFPVAVSSAACCSARPHPPPCPPRVCKKCTRAGGTVPMQKVRCLALTERPEDTSMLAANY